MFYWGTQKFIVLENSYEPPYPKLTVTELELIPAGVDTPASSIQTGGRGRKAARLGVLLANIGEYQSLYADYLLSTVKDIALPDFPAFPVMIKELGLPTYYKNGKIKCDIQFVEV